MARSLIIGGTRGLGRALAIGSLRRGITPIVTGRFRSLEQAKIDPELQGAEFHQFDLDYPAMIGSSGLAWGDISQVFWVAGIFMRSKVIETATEDIERMISTHLLGPIVTLREIVQLMKCGVNWDKTFQPPNKPFHLVTIGSTSSWKVRDNEAIYCALKAAKAHFTRNFARELVAELPGSKVTLVNPGGIKTPDFWQGSGQDISGYIEPSDLAELIWNEVLAQEQPFAEFQVLRHPTAPGEFYVQRGPHTPEQPF